MMGPLKQGLKINKSHMPLPSPESKLIPRTSPAWAVVNEDLQIVF